MKQTKKTKTGFWRWYLRILGTALLMGLLALGMVAAIIVGGWFINQLPTCLKITTILVIAFAIVTFCAWSYHSAEVDC